MNTRAMLISLTVLAIVATSALAQGPPGQAPGDVTLTETERLRAYVDALKRDRDGKEIQVSDLRALAQRAQERIDQLTEEVVAAKAKADKAEADVQRLTDELKTLCGTKPQEKPQGGSDQ